MQDGGLLIGPEPLARGKSRRRHVITAPARVGLETGFELVGPSPAPLTPTSTLATPNPDYSAIEQLE